MSRESSTPSKQVNISTLLADNLRSILTVVAVAVIVATLFTASTPPGLLSGGLTERLAEAIRAAATPTQVWPTPTDRPRPPIGIVVGHWGDNNDPGAVCADGLTEFQVNQDIAYLVQKNLSAEGFDVDLLQEFDPGLNGYQALVLVSIHADSCEYINAQATGFKVASTLNNPHPERSARLTACLRNRYAQATGLTVHNSVTPDMSSYHAFDEINDETPAAIIETGFLNLDRVKLTQETDQVARGISDGILCYLYNEDILPNPTDEP